MKWKEGSAGSRRSGISGCCPAPPPAVAIATVLTGILRSRTEKRFKYSTAVHTGYRHTLPNLGMTGSKTHCGMDPVSVRGVATWVRYFVITGR